MVKTIVIQQTKAFFYYMYVLFGTIIAVGLYALALHGDGALLGFGVGVLVTIFVFQHMNAKEKEEPESWMREN